MLYKRPFFIIRFLFMKHIIDIDTWERRDNYGFFRTFLNSSLIPQHYYKIFF